MEVNRLGHEELKYELQIRNLPTCGTFAQKRALVREALRDEREGRVSAPIETTIDPVSELCVCRARLLSLERDLQEAKPDDRDNLNARVYTLLLHTLLRLNRVFPGSESDVSERDMLVSKCTIMLSRFGGPPTHGDASLEVIHQGGLSSSEVDDSEGVAVVDLMGFEEGVASHSGNAHRSSRDNTETSHKDIAKSTGREDRDTSMRGDSRLAEFGSPVDQGDRGAREGVSYPGMFQPSAGVHSLSEHGPLGTEGAYGRRYLGPSSSGPNLFNSSAHQFSTRDGLPHLRDPVSSLPHFKQSVRFDAEPSIRENGYGLYPERFGVMDMSRTQLNNPWLPPVENSKKYAYVDRWNVKYDGKCSLSDFLIRIEELRLSRGVTKDQLMQSVPELLKDDALLWYRTRRFMDWDDFVTQLRHAFEPYDYENSLWDEIRRRTQGSQERVISFIVAMENMFRRLPTLPSESMRLQILRRNLLPYLQSRLSLQSVTTVDELLRMCRSIEETESRLQNFAPPPTNYRSLLEPDLAYRKPVSRVSAVERDEKSLSDLSENIPEVNAVQSEKSSRDVCCWNCREVGHRFSGCSKPRRKFCFRCGADNVISRDCRKCHSQKNDRQTR